MRYVPALKQTGIVCLLALVITSCQKELSNEDGPPKNTPSNCQLAKITYYDSSGNLHDTAGLVYTNDKITRVNFKDYYINLVYTNNRVSRINYFDHSGAQFDFYDSVTWNGNGKIESLIFYSGGTSGNEASGGYVISYNGDGTPSKVIEKTSSGGSALEDSYEYAFTYTGQNITKMIITDIIFSQSGAVNYTFDNNTNYFKSFPAEYIFADNIYFGISSLQFGFVSPFMFSNNNIATMQGAPVTYVKDSNGNLSEIKLGGIRATAYSYNCQ